MLKCRDVTELTTEYMEGAVPPARWLAVRFHFAICGMCRAYLGQMRRTRDLLGRIQLPLEPGVEDRVVARLAGQPPAG